MKILPVLFLFIGLAFLLSSFQEGPSKTKKSNSIALEQDTAQAAIWWEKARILYDSAKYDSALVAFQKAATIYKAHINANAPEHIWSNYLAINSSIGKTYVTKGNMEECYQLLEPLLEKGEQKFGAGAPILASIYHILGISYERKGQLEKATIYLKKVEQINIKKYGLESINTGSIFHSLGIICNRLNQYKTCLDYIDKALDIYQKVYGENHIQTANVYEIKGGTYKKLNELDKAIYYYEKTLAIRLKILDKNHPHLAGSYFSIGKLQEEKGNYQQALIFFNRALVIDSAAVGLLHYNVATDYSNIGGVYDKLGQFDYALQQYSKALNIRLKIYGEQSDKVASSYENFGNIYKNLNQYDKALEYYRKSLDIRLSLFSESHLDVSASYFNIGQVYFLKKQHNLAIDYLSRSLAIDKGIFGKEHPYIASTYNNLGAIYDDLKQFDIALDFYQKASTIWVKSYGINHPDVATNFASIAITHKNRKNYKEAIVNIQKASTILIELYGNDYAGLITIYNGFGEIYSEMRQYEKALQFLQKSMIINVLDFKEATITNNPSIRNEVLNKPWLLESLNLKANTLFHLYTNKSNKIEDLKLSEQTYLEAINWIDEIRNSFLRTEDKQFLLENAFISYEGGLNTSLYLFELTKKEIYLMSAFETCEKSRSFLMLDNLQTTQAKNFSKLPTDLLVKENDINTLLSHFEKKLFEEQQKKKMANIKNTTNWENKVFALKQSKDSLTYLLESQYPDYYHLKYNIEVTSLKAIQNSLPYNNIALLEYFIGDSIIYAFTISKENYQVHKIKKDFPLNGWVKQLRESTFTYHLTGSRSESLYKAYSDTLVQIAHQLYQKLLAPITSKMHLPEELIIIPDGVLGYLPFELLIKELPIDNTLFASHHYLLKDHQISYNYSATLWQEMQQKEHQSTPDNYLAFAPEFGINQPIASRTIAEVRTGLGALAFNISEVSAIQDQIGGQIFTGKNATKANFLQHAPSYKILHLSTHGKANDKIGDYAFLAFAANSDSTDYEKLYNRDLYNMRLNADMVVLSACETGIGELQKGEGVISLARGFSYAGAKSIITTLWSVNDAKTKELMEHFYTYIKMGKTKDAALRQAKLDFIDQYSHAAHPFFWASFISIGDMEAVNLNTSLTKWFLLASIAILLSLGMFFYRKYA